MQFQSHSFCTELTEVRAIGMTSIDSMMYSFIALPQSETIINLKSVNIDMGL